MVVFRKVDTVAVGAGARATTVAIKDFLNDELTYT